MDDAPDEKAIKDILKAMQEAKERESMTKEEKEAEAQREYDEEHGISEGARKLIEEVMETIAPLREKMLEIWKHLVGKAIGYKRVVVNRQTRGRLDVNRGLIREWPNIEDDTRKGEVKNHPIYERLGYEREVIDQPERIEVSVLVDVSGSMGKGNRIEIARSAAALLVYSLQDFNEQLRYTNRSKLVADSEVRLYSSGEITDGPAKGFLKGQSREDETTQIINMISKIGAYGMTNDVPSLNSILNSMTPEDKQKIKEMKLKKIVFEITDGTPDSITDSKKAIEALVNEGVIVVGFKIGGTINDGDGQNFDKIWKDDSAGQRGIFIGEKLNRLPEEMMKQLADLLSDIKI
jgi:hypothetical protein